MFQVLLLNGSEIRRSPVDMVNISHSLHGFIQYIFLPSTVPIGSMYGIFTYIYHKNQPNVGKYTIHGSYGSMLVSRRRFFGCRFLSWHLWQSAMKNCWKIAAASNFHGTWKIPVFFPLSFRYSNRKQFTKHKKSQRIWNRRFLPGVFE